MDNVQQQGPPGEREEGARAAGVESLREPPAAGAPKSERARRKIERVVLSNALTGRDIDAPDTTEGGVEDPERYSKE